MSTGLLSSAVSGMQAAQIALATAQHNISNQNTDGFNRQRIVQASNLAMLTGSGAIGQGTHVSTVERMYDSFLNNQVNGAQTSSSELETYYNQISQIDNMLADENSGLSPALQSFFTGLQQVSANPAQTAARQTMLSSAQSLVARYQGIETRLTEMYDGVNSQLQVQVASINSYAKQISELNQSIVVAQSAIQQPANDLLDQRDQLVAELNKLVSVSTTTNRDGSFNVFFGTGQQLVVGSQVMTMTATPSSSDPEKFVVGLSNSGGVQELPESLITGGSLGGLLKFRSESLEPAMNDLGRNAASLALTFNAQYGLGQDLLGQTAGTGNFTANFFTVSEPKVTASTRNNALTSAVVTASLAAPSIDGSYSLALNAAGTSYTLTRQSDGTTWQAGDLAALQALVPASEGLTLTAPTVTAGYSLSLNSAGTLYTLTRPDATTVTGATLAALQTAEPAGLTSARPGAKVTAGYTLALDSTGTLYTLTRPDSTTVTGATLAALQTAEPAGLMLTGVSVAAGSSTQVSGAAASGANFYTKLTNSDYQLSYGGTPLQYTVERLSDGASWSDANLTTLSTTVANSEGFSFSLASGSMSSGDSFLIRPVAEAARNLSVNSTVAGDARLIAAAMPISTSSASSNGGNGKISAGAATVGFGSPAISGSVSLTFNGGSLTLANVPAGANISVTNGATTTVYPGPSIPYTSGATISFAGVSFQITGNLNNGDSFTLAKNQAGVSDSRNALALGKLQTQNTMSGETATYQVSYAQLVSDIGNTTRQVSVTGEAQTALLTQSQDAREAMSGVNLDEEAANLIRYQQAYQASAKSLQIGTTLFDTLLGIMN